MKPLGLEITSKTAPTGFFSRQYDDSTGFGAQAYYSPTEATLVIAYAGTDAMSLADLQTDRQMTFNGGETQQNPLAVSFAEQAIATQRMIAINEGIAMSPVDAPQVVYTGHSLGGFLAQVVALYHDLDATAVAFNSPGVMGRSGTALEDAGYEYTTPRIPYVVSGDDTTTNSAIVNLGLHVAATVIRVAGVAGHGIQGLIDGLERAVQISQGWTRNDPGGPASGGSGGSGSGNGDGDTGSGAGATGGDAITTGNELSVDAGIVAPVATPPGTWSGGGTGTPDPGLPINPDYTGIQPIILDLDGDGVEVNAANGGWACEALRLAA